MKNKLPSFDTLLVTRRGQQVRALLGSSSSSSQALEANVDFVQASSSRSSVLNFRTYCSAGLQLQLSRAERSFRLSKTNEPATLLSSVERLRSRRT